jgi:hypothetical protein
MVSESIAGDKFDPVNVYVNLLDIVLVITFPNDKDVGFIVSVGVGAVIPLPLTVTVCVDAPPPAFVIVPV